MNGLIILSWQLGQAAKKTAGGIMLPETSQQKLNMGEVIAHGEGYMNEVSFITQIFSTINSKTSFKANPLIYQTVYIYIYIYHIWRRLTVFLIKSNYYLSEIG